jgi:hypothetical protein
MCAVPVTGTVSRRVFAIDMISIPPVPVVIATAIATEATLIVAAWGLMRRYKSFWPDRLLMD